MMFAIIICFDQLDSQTLAYTHAYIRIYTHACFSFCLGGVHRGNPLSKEWMCSGHFIRLDQELKPIVAKVENQEQEYSSKYATNIFNEVRIT